MKCEEVRVDLRIQTPERAAERARSGELVFQLNHTRPFTDEYNALLRELFVGGIGEGSFVAAPLSGAALNQVKIGKNVHINSNALFMARGGITIEDDVRIAANCSLISNNHDPYEREILICKPVCIRQGAWLGANTVVLPGVEIGRHAIVGAGSVVTKDIPDYAVAVGNPAHVVRMLDPEKFAETNLPA